MFQVSISMDSKASQSATACMSMGRGALPDEPSRHYKQKGYKQNHHQTRRPVQRSSSSFAGGASWLSKDSEFGPDPGLGLVGSGLGLELVGS